MADGAAAATAPAEPATETPVEQRAPMTETLTRPAHDAVTDGQARRPTKFMLDLTRAMRQAAGEARQSALAQFRVDVEHHTAEAQAACEAAAAEARRRADEDITALAEWETAEIARIRRETEEGITARHARLETEIADQMARLDEEVARVRARVSAFEAEMDAFFQHLAQEDDPGRFAGLAEQLPEAPAFDAWTPEIGDAAPELTANDTAEDGAGEPAAGTATVADQPADPDAGMPPMLPDDFAAAEAEAAEWVAVDDASPEAEVAAEMTAATDTAPEADGEGAAPWPPASAAAAAVTTSVRTQVAVVGLVSVASIATFKRLLARSAGVHGVAVASGPDGEFLFTATHDSTLDMPATVAAIQGFDVEVMESGPGIVMARAVDPEVV